MAASGKLELLSTGKLSGNITARSLVIDEDAFFDGRCAMVTNHSAALELEEEEPVAEEKEEAKAASAPGPDKY